MLSETLVVCATGAIILGTVVLAGIILGVTCAIVEKELDVIIDHI